MKQILNAQIQEGDHHSCEEVQPEDFAGPQPHAGSSYRGEICPEENSSQNVLSELLLSSAPFLRAALFSTTRGGEYHLLNPAASWLSPGAVQFGRAGLKPNYRWGTGFEEPLSLPQKPSLPAELLY